MTHDEFLSKYSKHLNDQQLEAVQAVDGPVLLLAVPGSGKTTVLVNRLGYMLYVAGIVPENILTLTYTVAATQDMAKRFEGMFGDEYSGRVEFRTINGICAKIITRYGRMINKSPFELLSDEKIKTKILAEILAKHMSEYPTESDIKGASTLITYCKNMCLTEEEIQTLSEEQDLPITEVYNEYNAYLKKNKLMDYDDQMAYALMMLKKSPELLNFYRKQYRYICVDEAQDTSKIQHLIIDLLAGPSGNLFMVGDEDQSIYGFRAAYPEALLNFEKAHPGARVLVMSRNYRSNANIVALADAFIQQNAARHDKHMVATRGEGSDVRFIEVRKRANQYGYLLKVAEDCKEETAVLYRDNECVLPLIDKLDRAGLRYRIKNMDMAFFTHRVVTDITNIIKFALNPADTELFMKIYFKCKFFLKKNQAEELCRISTEREISVLDAIEYASGMSAITKGNCRGMATNIRNMLKEEPSKALFRIETPMGYGDYLDRCGINTNKLFILKQLAYGEDSIEGFLNRLEYLQESLQNSESDYGCKFILSTVHSAKGLEYKNVYLMDICDGVFPGTPLKSMKAATPQEEKDFEEERRLFYVGMTRAKDNLNIFSISDETSCFIRELLKCAVGTNAGGSGGSIAKSGTAKPQSTQMRGTPVSDYELAVGEIVISEKYGKGAVKHIEYNEEGKADKFKVAFDSGEERMFMFPLAFTKGMKLASGVEVVRYMTTGGKKNEGYAGSKSYSYSSSSRVAYNRKMNRPDGAGASWSEEEDAQLDEEFKAGMKIPDMAKIHNRTSGGIRSRLKKHGLLKGP